MLFRSLNRHIEMVYTVIPAGEGRTVLLDKVNELLSELKDIFQGIYLIKDLFSDLAALKFEVLRKVGDAVGNIQAYQL